ncbi:hypothetical protein QKU58_gp025 [Pyramimonas orientalis virus]|uniref:Ankyrin repeat protein n=1 Tax=Pyramimonas orientalis virus 01B TaxID=3134525 RepID=A0A7M4CEQ7_9VIRU|nr:hypothetical protein QKU58_gp025 [Pyramimonas orientalis virus]QOI90163.1 hypothetical protein HWQ62_00025 [Pyramimonas orientalis virus]
MSYLMTEDEMDTMQRLLEAIMYNNIRQIAHEIVANGADINNNNNYDLFYGTPIHYATKQKCDSMTIKFMLYAGANINATDYYGDTPLHEVIRDNDIDRVNILVTMGADIYQKNNDNETPLELSIKNRKIYDVLIPKTNGHKKWNKLRPLIFTIDKLTKIYNMSLQRVWSPGGTGYHQCKRNFEALQLM